MSLLLLVLIILLLFGGGGFYGYRQQWFGSVEFGGFGLVGLILIVWLLLGGGAHAADAAASDVNGSVLFAVLKPFLEICAPILTAVLTALSVYAAAYIRAKWGIDLSRFDLEQDTAHRAALNTVLTNAAGGVIQRLGSASAALNVNVGNPVVAEFAKRAIQAAPAAAAHFGYAPADLEQKILNKIPQILPVDPIVTPAAVVVPASPARGL